MMFALMRTSLRFFVVGFIAGTLLAPRPGAETRRLLGEKFRIMANQLLELAALPPIEAGRTGQNGGDVARGRRSGATRGGSARPDA
ncbi:MAG: YtxH domain-containing protein [Chloroflexi bacterium]|nr:MAG: YtxH domain-containing protein [Chloroflexota bacterium]TMF24251.1 MAG: YtxH domain-containing protein [Chloroflexota bacterium]